MLFNSYSFIFAFLPLALFGYELAGRLGSRVAVLTWLILCSALFYALWNPLNLIIVAPSVAINYACARSIQSVMTKRPQARSATWLLIAGVVFNICFLGYFKYKNFFLDSVNTLFGSDFPLAATILPLGISFITFQKIAFLVDVRTGAVKRFSVFEFLTFVFFFPQLIAGPIVHYREMMPQFAGVSNRLDGRNIAVGLSLFAMGLFKKAVLADGIAPYANSVFGAAEQGHGPGFCAAWLGALAYTVQIYFDFSGYSDMAIGLARMFGIVLPANFNSPLKASSIIEFWARWHMTLTRFLTAYIYNPMVMRLTRTRMARGKTVIARAGTTLSAFAAVVAWPTMLTMFVSGLWHGAGVTFILWGLLHGVYLTINHAWRIWRPRWDKAAYERWMQPAGFVITFLAVLLAMVLFRAKSMGGAGQIYSAIAGLKGVSLPEAVIGRLGFIGELLGKLGVSADTSSGSTFVMMSLWVGVLLLIAIAMPNSLEVMQRFEPALNFQIGSGAHRDLRNMLRSRLVAVLTPRWAAVFGMLLLVGVFSLNRVTEFLYWQF